MHVQDLIDQISSLIPGQTETLILAWAPLACWTKLLRVKSGPSS